MVGKIVAVCDGKRAQTSRIEKTLKKNQGVYRPELKGTSENVERKNVQGNHRPK